MKISTILLTLIISCSLCFGQYGKDFEDMSDSEKYMVYNSHRKSPTTGVLLEWLLPTLGHAYAGNWKRGLAFKGGQIGFIFALDLVTESDGIFHIATEEIYPFFIGLGLIQIWEFVDVGMETKKYNYKLYREIFGKEPPSFSLNLHPTYQGANLTLAYKFD